MVTDPVRCSAVSKFHVAISKSFRVSSACRPMTLITLMTTFAPASGRLRGGTVSAGHSCYASNKQCEIRVALATSATKDPHRGNSSS